jgi:adenosylcobinamide hydrolase
VSAALVVELGGSRRCLSSAVLGGGLRSATHWLNLQVPHGYARRDPDVHLAAEARARGLPPGQVIGMLTAADVRAVEVRQRGAARVHATVGIGQPLAAAGRTPRSVPRAGTINLLVVIEAALTDAALAGALQTATEAKAQALAGAGVRAVNHPGAATGTATDSVCIAALDRAAGRDHGQPDPFAGPATAASAFAGPATAVGAAIATAVHAAVLAGARAYDATRRSARA